MPLQTSIRNLEKTELLEKIRRLDVWFFQQKLKIDKNSQLIYPSYWKSKRSLYRKLVFLYYHSIGKSSRAEEGYLEYSYAKLLDSPWSLNDVSYACLRKLARIYNCKPKELFAMDRRQVKTSCVTLLLESQKENLESISLWGFETNIF